MGEWIGENPLVLVIGACEVGFWVLLGLGLAARYLLRVRRLSTVLLLGVPVLDVVLVGATLLDVAGGRRRRPCTAWPRCTWASRSPSGTR
ncbi:hypothetical protein [Pseudonocardia sp. NPDC049154]|uniref:hypothetical protein n=1 Tax=Pseudonocardia sp. NPDC049154 TaxID=3155501 RepID=UPI00340F053B